MTDTLSQERVAEIRARVADCANVADMYLAFDKPVIAKRLRISVGDVSVLLASHEALRAEVERLREGRDTMGNLWASEKERNATARDTAAREMREQIMQILIEEYDKCGLSLIAEAKDRINALPLPSETKERGS